jgi:hypothetical protein
MFLEDDVEGESAASLTCSTGELEHATNSDEHNSLNLQSTPPRKGTGAGNGADSPTEFMFPSDSVDGTPIKISQTELLHGYENRERLLGKTKGIQLASRQKGAGLSQAECYQLCGITYPEGAGSTPSTRYNNGMSPPSKASNGKTDSSSSPLSDAPSDLSDWESSKKKVRSERF